MGSDHLLPTALVKLQIFFVLVILRSRNLGIRCNMLVTCMLYICCGIPVIFWPVLGMEAWVITAPLVIATPRTLHLSVPLSCRDEGRIRRSWFVI
jgi:hypothetical protein